jgi:hypothetical protein
MTTCQPDLRQKFGLVLGRRFPRSVTYGIMTYLVIGDRLLRLVVSFGGEAMKEENSENGRNRGDAPGSRRESRCAEGMAMAVAIAILAAFTSFLFCG